MNQYIQSDVKMEKESCRIRSSIGTIWLTFIMILAVNRATRGKFASFFLLTFWCILSLSKKSLIAFLGNGMHIYNANIYGLEIIKLKNTCSIPTSSVLSFSCNYSIYPKHGTNKTVRNFCLFFLFQNYFTTMRGSLQLEHMQCFTYHYGT